MIKDKNTMSQSIVIDLTGPDGNAFALMGKARRIAKTLEWPKEDIDKMISQMMSGDYENLVNVFEENFGSFVTLYR